MIEIDKESLVTKEIKMEVIKAGINSFWDEMFFWPDGASLTVQNKISYLEKSKRTNDKCNRFY